MDAKQLPPIWAAVIEQFDISLAAGGQAATSRRLRRQQLTQLGRFVEVDVADVTTAHLEGFLSQPGWKPETRHSARSALRVFFAWALRAELIASDPAAQLAKIRRPMPYARAVPDGAMVAALSLADDRGALMIRLAGQHGLRRAEIAQVHRDDVEVDLLGHSLLVHGKGGKLRRVPLADDVAAVLLAADGYVFPGQIDGHLSPDRVGKILKGLLPPGYTAHKLRHRFATTAYAIDHDVFAVQQLLGHASPATTLRYVQLPDNAGRRLVEAVAIS